MLVIIKSIKKITLRIFFNQKNAIRLHDQFRPHLVFFM